MWAVRLGLLGLTAGALFAQHEFSPGDARDGQRLFLASCALCHGPEGDGVPGVDLGHGKFRRASSDGELVTIIQKGIAGTAMPPHSYSDFQAGTIVAYMRFMAASATDSTVVPGDRALGKAVFESKGCMNCHRVQGKGSRLGPELTDIGSVRRAVELKTSILDPNAEVLAQNRFFRVVTRDGTTITGRLLNLDPFTVQMIDSKERLLSFSKSSLKEYNFVEKSPMPSFQNRLTDKELADLVSYLASLKGIDNL
jgi:putative heme-binding domain-containing protein